MLPLMSPFTIACVTDLKGKTVFITGAARRLGKAIALAMAQAGANVAFTYLLSEEESLQTLKEIKAKGVQLSPSDATSRRKKGQRCRQSLGALWPN